MLYRLLLFLTVILGYAGLTCLGPNRTAMNGALSPSQKAPQVHQNPEENRLAALNYDPEPTKLNQVQVQLPRVAQPKLYRGIYLNNHHGRDLTLLNGHIQQMKKYGLNTLVVDVQPRLPDKEHLSLLKQNGIYSVARLVCFHYGLKTIRPTEKKMQRLLKRAEEAAQLGFDELQLDYIRYADAWGRTKVSIRNRYRILEEIMLQFKARIKPYNIKIGADIFGRIPFNNNDIIGQKIEVFGAYMDVLYPMLYPSHFTGDPVRQKKPFYTIYDGVERSVQRLSATPATAGTRVVAYIQAFKMRYRKSGLSYRRYIYDQVAAAEQIGSGWVAWNAGNRYQPMWNALDLIMKHGYTLAPKPKIKNPSGPQLGQGTFYKKASAKDLPKAQQQKPSSGPAPSPPAQTGSGVPQAPPGSTVMPMNP